MDAHAKKAFCLNNHLAAILTGQRQQSGRKQATGIPDGALSYAALFLPRGYPESVSEDYLDYQLWAFPSHVLVSLDLQVLID